MATRIPSDQLINTQSLEAAVNGPDEANRLFVFTGAAPVGVSGGAGGNARGTFTFLLGPKLARRQFISAVAHASISAWGGFISATPFNFSVALELAEADWDDESQQVEARIEVAASMPQGGNLSISRIDYSVTVLAQM